MQPKQPFFPNVKTVPQSSHHENYRTVLTFRWFGGAFLSMSAQKLAILADPIWIFYKVGIVGLAKNCSRPQHKKNKRNTKAHNNQNEPPPYPPADLSSIAMETSVMDPNIGAASHHESMQGSRQGVWWRRGQFLCLGCQCIPHQKI